jgi:hypothetical protein
MKFIIPIFVSFVLFIFLTACNSSDSPSQSGDSLQPNIINQTYNNPQIGFSVTFPDDWSMTMNVKIGEYDAALFAEKDIQLSIRPNVTVILEGANSKPPMDALLSGVKDLLPTMLDNVDILEEKITLINGNECAEIIYTFSEEDVHFKQKQLYFFNKMFIIVISFNATKDTYDSFLNDLTFIQDSIELKID